MSAASVPISGTGANSRIDRFALRIAKRTPVPVMSGRATPAIGNDQLSRRRLLFRALGASVLAILPLRLADPSTAQADGYCAAQCLGDATAANMARFHTLNVRAFGVDFAGPEDFNLYVASKIKAGGLGALVIVNEILQADRDIVASEIRYHYDAGKCGTPNCGDPRKYPLRPGCEICAEFCCFCPTGTVAAGCLPGGSASSCDRSCAACLQSKAGGFPVHGQC
ncbi:MAG TPA: hypothetical protein VMU39_24425 [Solirubrobacteraceae bacterium]|nr:hypothetical protein [Solirubrobacteraceae bacterium]